MTTDSDGRIRSSMLFRPAARLADAGGGPVPNLWKNTLSRSWRLVYTAARGARSLRDGDCRSGLSLLF